MIIFQSAITFIVGCLKILLFIIRLLLTFIVALPLLIISLGGGKEIIFKCFGIIWGVSAKEAEDILTEPQGYY